MVSTKRLSEADSLGFSLAGSLAPPLVGQAHRLTQFPLLSFSAPQFLLFARDRVHFLRKLALEYSVKSDGSSSRERRPRQELMIAWSKPEHGWMKLNTDGAAMGNPGLASAGGVLRNSEGEWCGGFALNIGVCSATMAELWGVYYGLHIAWERGHRRVLVEVDSMVVMGFIQKGVAETHPLSFLVRMCYGFTTRDWIVRFNHVYREANCLADGLADYAHSLSIGFHYFPTLPPLVGTLFQNDCLGFRIPRLVCNPT